MGSACKYTRVKSTDLVVYTHLRVLQLKEETFVIHTRSCVYFVKQKATTNLFSKQVTPNVFDKK